MRRIVIVDALGQGALHFYCGGRSVLIDAFAESENMYIPLSAETMHALIEGKGKFKRICGALYTGCKVSSWCNKQLQLPIASVNCPASSDRFDFDGITACRYVVANTVSCMWLLSVKGISVLVCGNAADADIISTVDRLPNSVQHAFVPLSTILNGRTTYSFLQKGIKHLFVYYLPEHLSDDENVRLNKRINRLSKLGFIIRVINSYPTGIII